MLFKLSFFEDQRYITLLVFPVVIIMGILFIGIRVIRVSHEKSN